MNPHTQTQSDTLTLYYREGTSDKVYQAAIEPAGDGLYAVTFAYGRRGGTLNTGRKTNRPVSYGEAKSIFDRLCARSWPRATPPVRTCTPTLGGNGDQHLQVFGRSCSNPIDATECNVCFRTTSMSPEKFVGRLLLARPVPH